MTQDKLECPFEEYADFSKLKEAAAMLRLHRPDLAMQIEIAIDELEELRGNGEEKQT